MFNIEWFSWPLLVFLGILFLYTGSRKLIQNKNLSFNKKNYWIKIFPMSKIGYFEILTGITFILPAIIVKNPVVLFATIGAILAIIISILKILIFNKSIYIKNILFSTSIIIVSVFLLITITY